MYDQYGRPFPPGHPGYGVPSDAYVGGGMGPQVTPYGSDPANPRPAVLQMPFANQMGGKEPGTPAWVRQPYFPTSPFLSTDPNVGYQTRYYSVSLTSADSDFVLNSETIRPLQFDIPVRLIAINGSAFNTSAAGGNALPVGVGPRDCWLLRVEYTNGDRLMVNSRLASTVCGTSEQPGELGGTGWTFDQGASDQVGITPLLANLRIDVTFQCLEMRGPRNYMPR